MNPFIKSLNSYFSLRIYQFNNVFIDYFFRPCPNSWKVKAASILSNDSPMQIEYADKYFKNNYFTKFKSDIDIFISDFHKVFGNGFYAHDFILCNEKLYFCESGLKFIDYALYDAAMSSCSLLDKTAINPGLLLRKYLNLMFQSLS